jgi:hypothetical protein
MLVIMERQSVSMRDYKRAPNKMKIEILDNCRLKDFIQILSKSYCPQISEKRGVWVLWDRHKAVAVFDSKTKKYKGFNDEKLLLKDIINRDDDIEMYLYYKGTADIEYVLEELIEELLIG